jgi:hypothetical protein
MGAWDSEILAPAFSEQRQFFDRRHEVRATGNEARPVLSRNARAN